MSAQDPKVVPTQFHDTNSEEASTQEAERATPTEKTGEVMHNNDSDQNIGQQSAEPRQRRPRQYGSRSSQQRNRSHRQPAMPMQQQSSDIMPAGESEYITQSSNQPRDSRQDQQGSGQQYNQPHHPRQQQQQYKPSVDTMNLHELNIYARRLGIVGATLMAKEDLKKKIKFIEVNPDFEIEVEGVLEKLPDGFGFLRSARFDYVSGPDDIYVSPSQIRRFNLRTGDTVNGSIRKPKDGEKYFALLKVAKVNGQEPSLSEDRLNFDRLSPLHPEKKFNLEYSPTALSTRIMDLFTPVGKGQRGLIVAQPKVGKTMLMKEMVQAMIANHPETTVIVLLIDERPEEVADMRRAVIGTGAEVVSSTFDESPDRHVQVAEIVLEKAKRLVEVGKDVVIFLDSLTRLARAYNAIAPASGKILTGGVDANALQRPKRFFGAARNTEEGGSLTILASSLIDTGSRMDEVIYEEFKGTGNMEMHMTRKLSNRRVYPAFDLLVSGTRRDELLHSEEDLNKVWVMQKFLATMNAIEGMEFLIDKMKKHKTNAEFLESINKKNTALTN